MAAMFRTALMSALLMSATLAVADDTVAVRAAVDAANHGFTTGLEAKSAAQMATNYGPGARLIPPGEADVVGGPEIEKYWQGFMDQGVAALKLVTDEFETSGELAVERGHAELAFADTTKPPASVKYLVVWRKQPDGTWKILFDSWNDFPKPEAAKAAPEPPTGEAAKSPDGG